MFITLPSTAELYDPFYREQLIVVKASGKELLGEGGRVIVEQIAELVRRGVRIIFPNGGGEQITQLYLQKFGEKRPMQDGVAITTPRVLECAREVHERLQREILGLFRDALPDCPIGVVDPRNVQCDYMDFERRGFVGVPKAIDHDFTRDAITLVGFNAYVGRQRVNANADDVVLQIVRQLHRTSRRVVEAFLLTETRGVKDLFGTPDERLVPTMFAQDIRPDGTHPEIPIDGGMKKKMKNAKQMTPYCRVVVTGKADITDEIYSVGGKGTLIVDRERLVADDPTDREKSIIRHVIDDYTRQGKFRWRPDEQVQEAIKHHLVLTEYTPLSGCAVLPHPDGSVEMATLWSEYNGMGTILADKAKARFLERYAERDMFFTLGGSKPEEAKQAIRRFTRYGFHHRGLLSDVKEETDIPPHLREYDTAKRNPHVFTITREQLANESRAGNAR